MPPYKNVNMIKVSFLGKEFNSEEDRNSYAFQDKDNLIFKLEQKKNNTIAGGTVGGLFLGIIIGLAISSWIIFFVCLFGLPWLLVSLKKPNLKIKKIQEYSKIHENHLSKIEKAIRKEIIDPYNKRYYTAEQKIEHVSDLVNLINHKKKTNLTDKDGIFLLSSSEKEHNIDLFDKSVSELNDNSPNNFAKILIKLAPETDFENEEDYDSILKQFCEYLERKKIDCDVENLKQELASQYKMQKATQFEEKLSRNQDNKISIEEIEHLDGFAFEQLIGDLLRKAGYKVKVTKKSGDQGADLIVEKDGISTAIQTKKYSGSVGNKAVQEIVAAMKFYDCSKAIVITTGDFTKGAYELADRNGVQLIDRKALNDLFDSIL